MQIKYTFRKYRLYKLSDLSTFESAIRCGVVGAIISEEWISGRQRSRTGVSLQNGGLGGRSDRRRVGNGADGLRGAENLLGPFNSQRRRMRAKRIGRGGTDSRRRGAGGCGRRAVGGVGGAGAGVALARFRESGEAERRTDRH